MVPLVSTTKAPTRRLCKRGEEPSQIRPRTGRLIPAQPLDRRQERFPGEHHWLGDLRGCIPFVSILSGRHREEITHIMIYWISNQHPTEAGHAKIAGLFEAWLQKWGLHPDV